MRLTLLSLLSVCALYAQSPTASVTGRITDASGGVVPNVAIKIINVDTAQARAGLTNSAGDYTVPFLAPGRYTLEADGKGFSTYKHTQFNLDLDQEQRIDIQLQVGSAGQTITVSETPESLNTESGSRGDVTSSKELTEIPLNGRNYSDLAYQTAGVVNKSDNTDGQFSVNGARADNVSFMVDGMNNTQRRNLTVMVSPPLEGVQEFKMITSGFSAEYGRFAGGVLSMVTKSGGNQFHGAVYEFLRNNALDARNFFDATKSKLIQNQFGAAMTGPVWVPKIYNGHNKTFFLASWESQRQISGITSRGAVPTPAMLTGDFSKATDAFGKPSIIVDPLAKNTPFVGNKIPSTRLDPVALALAANYPAPNVFGNVNNYIAQGNSTNDYNKFNFKVDHSLGANDKLTFSTLWNPVNTAAPFISSRSPVAKFPSTNDTFGLLSGIRYLHIFSPTLFSESSLNFSRNTLRQLIKLETPDPSIAAGFKGATKDPLDYGLPYFTVSGYIDLGPAYDLPKVWSWNNLQAASSMTWVHGKHAVKFGGDFLHFQYFSHDYSDLRGRMTFLGRFTSDPVADLVLGYAQTSRRQTQVGSSYLLDSNYSAFIQDDYKITSRLTLNVGLRYELMKQPVEKYGAWAAFVPSVGKVVLAGLGVLSQSDFNSIIQATGLASSTAMAKDVGLPPSLVKTNYKNFAPRFGFAWRPFDNRSVIRGGYGIFYGSDSLYRYLGYTNVIPWSNTQTYTATSTNPLALTVSDIFPTAKTKAASLSSPGGLPDTNPTQYLQSYNLTFERDLGAGTVIEVAYAGSKGTHLPQRYNVNQQPLTPGVGLGPRAFPVFGSITIIADASNSIYNSGTATIRRRLNGTMFVRASYVYSKSIDLSSNTAGVLTAQNPWNLGAERGRSDFDVGHTFLASFIWTPRFSRNFLLKDWQISGTSSAYTGLPFNPQVANFDVTVGGASRPDRIANGRLDNPSPDRWFDRTAFPVVPTGAFRYGNSGRNVLDGPGFFTTNVGLSRRFRFRDTKALQFRGEAFNLTNRANFGLPNAQVDTLSGGTITTAKSPRLMQLGLRLEF